MTDWASKLNLIRKSTEEGTSETFVCLTQFLSFTLLIYLCWMYHTQHSTSKKNPPTEHVCIALVVISRTDRNLKGGFGGVSLVILSTPRPPQLSFDSTGPGALHSALLKLSGMSGSSTLHRFQVSQRTRISPECASTRGRGSAAC